MHLQLNIREAFLVEILYLIKGKDSKETVVLRRWEGIADNLVLTTELKT